MSAEELKLECQCLRDENHQLQLKVCGVNELTKLLQDRSELIQVLEEKNKRLEIAIVRLENRCASDDRMLKSQKVGAFISTCILVKSNHANGQRKDLWCSSTIQLLSIQT